MDYLFGRVPPTNSSERESGRPSQQQQILQQLQRQQYQHHQHHQQQQQQQQQQTDSVSTMSSMDSEDPDYNKKTSSSALPAQELKLLRSILMDESYYSTTEDGPTSTDSGKNKDKDKDKAPPTITLTINSAEKEEDDTVSPTQSDSSGSLLHSFRGFVKRDAAAQGPPKQAPSNGGSGNSSSRTDTNTNTNPSTSTYSSLQTIGASARIKMRQLESTFVSPFRSANENQVTATPTNINNTTNNNNDMESDRHLMADQKTAPIQKPTSSPANSPAHKPNRSSVFRPRTAPTSPKNPPSVTRMHNTTASSISSSRIFEDGTTSTEGEAEDTSHDTTPDSATADLRRVAALELLAAETSGDPGFDLLLNLNETNTDEDEDTATRAAKKLAMDVEDNSAIGDAPSVQSETFSAFPLDSHPDASLLVAPSAPGESSDEGDHWDDAKLDPENHSSFLPQTLFQKTKPIPDTSSMSSSDNGSSDPTDSGHQRKRSLLHNSQHRSDALIPLTDDPLILRMPNTGFGICLGLAGNAVLWKTIANVDFLFVGAMDVFRPDNIEMANTVLWFAAFVSAVMITLAYAYKCLFHWKFFLLELNCPTRIHFCNGPNLVLMLLTLSIPDAVSTSTLSFQIIFIVGLVYQTIMTQAVYSQWMFGNKDQKEELPSQRDSSSANQQSKPGSQLSCARPQFFLSIVGWFMLAIVGVLANIDESWGIPLSTFCVGIGGIFGVMVLISIFQGLHKYAHLRGSPALTLLIAPPSVAVIAIQGITNGTLSLDVIQPLSNTTLGAESQNIGPSTIEQGDFPFAGELILGWCCFMVLILLRLGPKICQNPSSFGVYWAYVFPLSSLATALTRYGAVINTRATQVLAIISIALSTLALMIVCLRMLWHLLWTLCNDRYTWGDPLLNITSDLATTVGTPWAEQQAKPQKSPSSFSERSKKTQSPSYSRKTADSPV